MNYQKIMNEEKKTFNVLYQEICEQIEKDIGIEDQLAKKLKEKREFGYNKYKEFSFQSSFENSLSSPTEEHLEEELVDAINYCIHNIFKKNSNYKLKEKDVIFGRKLLDLYNEYIQNIY